MRQTKPDVFKSDVFMRSDVAALLAAIALTAVATGGNSPHDAAYRRGFAAAVAAVATALHIAPEEISGRLDVWQPGWERLEVRR
jgi:hypothetical protein